MSRIFASLLIFCLLVGGCTHTHVPEETHSVVVADAPEKFTAESRSLDYAIMLIQERKYPQAIAILSKLEDTTARSLLEQTRYAVSGSYISAGMWSVAALDAVTHKPVLAWCPAPGKDDLLEAASQMPPLKSISISWKHGSSSVDGVSIEGEFCTTSTITAEERREWGNTNISLMADVIDEVSGWSGIQQMQAEWPACAIALMQDGSVRACYPYADDQGERFIGEMGWNDIVSVYQNGSCMVGLSADGSVVSYNCPYGDELTQWEGIVDMDFYHGGAVGLKNDGTVICAGTKIMGEDTTDSWQDIIAISAEYYTILGLRRDGTVITSGHNRGQLDVEDWQDIVAIDCDDEMSIGLRADGTMAIATGPNAGLTEVSELSGLYVPEILRPTYVLSND